MMDYKRANRAYLYMILATIAFVIVYSGWIIMTGRDISLIANNVVFYKDTHFFFFISILFGMLLAYFLVSLLSC